MSSSPTSPSSRCVRDALFLPDEVLSRLSLLVAAGSKGSGDGNGKKGGNSAAVELALIIRIGELSKRLDAALSLMRVWWDASLENDVSEKMSERQQERKKRRMRGQFDFQAVFLFFLFVAR